MPKINQEEYEVLKELDERAKSIVRQDRGWLWVAEQPIMKDDIGWYVEDGFDVKLKDDNLFQFIQWEDESPYNIQELIEEYERYEIGNIHVERKHPMFNCNRFNGFYNANIAIWDRLEESEETEVKTKREIIKNIDGEINYVKEKLPKMDREKSEGRKEWHEGYLVAMKEARNKVNQLDEPETLSQEWISEHKESLYFNDTMDYYVHHEELEDLLVPKQEREQKYNVKFKVKSSFGTVGIFLYKKGDEVLAGDNFRAYYPKEDEYRLTEQEIRDFHNGDILFEHFAVKVEELEE